jgi:hypothetical protein
MTMSTINNILIKRRLPDSPLTTLPILSGGELGFNEKNYTLYYGASGLGTIAIAGDGSFVNRSTSQDISGNKTFLGLTTLSSTTFSSNSLINIGSNLITNVLDPLNAQDAATKQYVDDLSSTISSDFVDRSTNQTISGNKTFEDDTTIDANLTVTGYADVTSYVDANSYKIDGTQVIDSSRNATFANISASGDLTVTGSLSVLGGVTTLETTTTIASSFSITNTGTDLALTVTQTGNTDIAKFVDDTTTALIVKNGGNVGINTDFPNEKLTVSGNISASGTIFGTNADFLGTLEVDQSATFNSSVTIVTNLSGTANSSALYNFIIDGGNF